MRDLIGEAWEDIKPHLEDEIRSNEMNKAQQREMAIRAARSQARKQGIEPLELGAEDALAIIDDIARSEPDLVASHWYSEATDNQINLFKIEWRKWVASQTEMMLPHMVPPTPLNLGGWGTASERARCSEIVE